MVGTTLIVMLWHVNQIKIKIGVIFFLIKNRAIPSKMQLTVTSGKTKTPECVPVSDGYCLNLIYFMHSGIPRQMNTPFLNWQHFKIKTVPSVACLIFEIGMNTSFRTACMNMNTWKQSIGYFVIRMPCTRGSF